MGPEFAVAAPDFSRQKRCHCSQRSGWSATCLNTRSAAAAKGARSAAGATAPHLYSVKRGDIRRTQ